MSVLATRGMHTAYTYYKPLSIRMTLLLFYKRTGISQRCAQGASRYLQLSISVSSRTLSQKPFSGNPKIQLVSTCFKQGKNGSMPFSSINNPVQVLNLLVDMHEVPL